MKVSSFKSGDVEALVSKDASALIRAGAAYWTEKCDGRPMPHRRDIDPIEFRRLLGNVVLMDVLREPLDFVERITGETVQHHNHRNYMGIPWRELPERGPDSKIFQFFESIVQSRQPRYDRVPYVGPHKHFLRVEVLACPLADDRGDVYKVLSYVDYRPREDSD